MNFPGNIKPRTALPASAICASLLGIGMLLSSALAQSGETGGPVTAKASQPDGNVVALEQNWDGLWRPVGGLVFDPKYFVRGKRPEDVRIYPPYKPEWEAKYKAIKARHAQGIGDDPLGYCGPHGMPRVLGGAPGPIEIIIKPRTIYLIWEYLAQTRRVYTDGSKHPPTAEAFPSHMGHSIGHWEGKTLTVDTVLMLGNMPFDRTGAPHSDQVHTIERIHMLDKNTIEDQITILDPVAFTGPWVVTRQWKRMPADAQMQDVYCDLQRNPIVDGQTQVLLPGEPGYDEAMKMKQR